jgi:osmotically inducible protein OsmC
MCGGIGANDAGGFGLTVDLEAKVAGLSQEDAEKVVAAGHKAWPYWNAMKGNVDGAIQVVAAWSSPLDRAIFDLIHFRII